MRLVFACPSFTPRLFRPVSRVQSVLYSQKEGATNTPHLPATSSTVRLICATSTDRIYLCLKTVVFQGSNWTLILALHSQTSPAGHGPGPVSVGYFPFASAVLVSVGFALAFDLVVLGRTL